MTDHAAANLLAKTYFHRISAWRSLPQGGEERLCEGVECAMSRSAHTSAPAPSDSARAFPEADYRVSLFTRPELWFRLGDRLEVTDGTGRVFRGRASDSVAYPSHCATVMEVREVLPPVAEEPEEDEDSCESCPKPMREVME